jgi:hypothetical protein
MLGGIINQQAGILGTIQLPHLRGPMARTALPKRLSWQIGTVIEVIMETQRVKSLVLDVPGWLGHMAGQHVDLRLTAEDLYQTQRSYSIASPPEARHITLTVERLDDGKVSPYLTDVLTPGDPLELRGSSRVTYANSISMTMMALEDR